jgi:hypothetical protein
MTRSRRCMIAWLGIAGLVFAQLAVTAHACMTGASVQATAAAAAARGHQEHCAGAQGTAPLAPLANACEVQCTDGAPSAAAPDLPAVTLAILPVAPAPVDLSIDTREWDRAILVATSAGPPPLLQYCRLLN